MTIRECRIEDAERIQLINKTALGYDYNIDATKSRLKKLLKSDRDRIYVAEIDSLVVGYIHGEAYEVIYAPSYINVMGLAVLEEYRRNGVGKALLQTLEGYAKFCGFGGVRLNSGEQRTQAHKFYESLGYDGNKMQIRFIKQF